MEQVPVTIYTTPNCVQCNATKHEFDKHNIDYEVIDLSQHPELADTFRERGLTQAPIVTTDTKEWSGFRREKILSLANYIKSLRAHEPEQKPTVLDTQSNGMLGKITVNFEQLERSRIVTAFVERNYIADWLENLIVDGTQSEKEIIKALIEPIRNGDASNWGRENENVRDS